MSTFIEIKNAYQELRNEERTKIINYLKEHGFKVSSRGGKGKNDYTANGTLKRPFDLSNWKYIDASKDDRHFCISLQSFDKDPGTKNRHVLMDRIGVYVYEKYNAEEAFEQMIITDIDLPMNEESLGELVNVLDSCRI